MSLNPAKMPTLKDKHDSQEAAPVVKKKVTKKAPTKEAPAKVAKKVVKKKA